MRILRRGAAGRAAVAAAGVLAAVGAGLGAGAAHADANPVAAKVVADPQSYFVPRHGDAGYVAPYTVALASSSETDLVNARATFDLSSLGGAVDVAVASGAHGCTQQALVVSCDLGDFYQRTEISPVTLTARDGTPVGAAGTIELTVTADNAPTVHRATAVVVGRPRLTVLPNRSGELPTDTGSVTPAFGNSGDVAITQGITVRISGTAPTGRTVTNCRYNAADRPTTVECDFAVRLEPGQAFRTDTAFAFTAPSTDPTLGIDYQVWPTGNPPEFVTALPADAPHGTTGPVALEPADAAALVPGTGYEAHYTTYDGAHGSARPDLAATPFTITGKVGQTLDVQVPYPTDRKHEPVTVGSGQLVTVPQGTHAVALGKDEETEAAYCAPATGRQAMCPFGPDGYGTVLRVHIDAKVPGASGTIEVLPPAGQDSDPSNNTAVISLVVTGGTPSGSTGGTTAGSSGSSGSSSSGSATGGSSGTGGGSGTSGGTDGGSGPLASTGSGSVLPLTGAAVAALLTGTGAFVAVRRRRRS